MNGYLRLVQQFRQHIGTPDAEPLVPMDAHLLSIHKIGLELISSAKRFREAHNIDGRFIQSEKLLEEVGELLVALAEGRLDGVLDGVTDSIYVLLGIACAYKLPLDQAFMSVHLSNMTKKKRKPGQAFDNSPRGADYVPPDLDGVLRGDITFLQPMLDLYGLEADEEADDIMPLLKLTAMALQWSEQSRETAMKHLVALDRAICESMKMTELIKMNKHYNGDLL